MLEKLRRVRDERADDDNGFTLIELLVVVVIIGILIAIAIPLYLNYEKGAKDKSAQSDLRGAVSALEQCSTDGSTLPAAATSWTTSGAAPCTGQSISLSTSTTIDFQPITGGYVITSKNSDGSGKVYCYDSTKGGAVANTGAALNATSC